MAMSQEHKAALAKGRKEARSISAYLDSLNARKRGRPVTESSVKSRLEIVRKSLQTEGNSLRRVELLQKRLDLEKQLKNLADRSDRAALENAFVAAAKSYSERKGISYAAWREAGVPAATLARAGITR